MIEVLGARRLLGLGVMLALVAALAGAYYMILTPHQDQLERKLRKLKTTISTREAETNKLREDFEKLDEVKFQYNRILNYGFFSEQDRVFARNKIQEVRELSGVISARYEIEPVETEENEDIKAANHRLLRSKITFDIDAFDDIDVYEFIYFMNYGFPGVVAVRDIDIKREAEINVPVLQTIGSGQAMPLVSAAIEMDWYSVAPDIQADENGGGQ